MMLGKDTTLLFKSKQRFFIQNISIFVVVVLGVESLSIIQSSGDQIMHPRHCFDYSDTTF